MLKTMQVRNPLGRWMTALSLLNKPFRLIQYANDQFQHDGGRVWGFITIYNQRKKKFFIDFLYRYIKVLSAGRWFMTTA
jgi:hypothetical protein